MKRLIGPLMAFALIAAACSDSATDSSPDTTATAAVTTTTISETAPATTAPAVATASAPATTEAPAPTTTEAPPAEPAAGDLVSAEPVDAGELNGWRITYLSTGVRGDLVEVSGLVFAPPGMPANSPVVLVGPRNDGRGGCLRTISGTSGRL